MRTLVRHLVPVIVIALAPMAAVTIATPGSEFGAMRERRVVGSEGQRVSAARRAASSAMRCRPVVGPDG